MIFLQQVDEAISNMGRFAAVNDCDAFFGFCIHGLDDPSFTGISFTVFDALIASQDME